MALQDSIASFAEAKENLDRAVASLPYSPVFAFCPHKDVHNDACDRCGADFS